jgi:methylaspartate mutase sigma subunit
VLTSVSSDSHTWNLVFLQLLLEYMGHQVTNLGACTPDEDIIDACKQHAPDLLVVSTVNGHGNIDGQRLIGRLRREPELEHLPAVIGGQLGVRGSEDRAALTNRLLRAGFTAVFDGSSVPAFLDLVEHLSPNTPRLALAEVAA